MATDDALLGLPLTEALSRLDAGTPAPTIVRSSAPRPRHVIPADDAGWRLVRIDAGSPAVWVVAPAIALPAS